METPPNAKEELQTAKAPVKQEALAALNQLPEVEKLKVLDYIKDLSSFERVNDGQRDISSKGS